MHKVGLTTTVPIEIVFAGGCIPVDLNNLFISQDGLRLINQAEMQGFPRSLCAWIKGIYSVTLQEGIDRVIGVIQGDCSNTQALLETLSIEGIQIIPFAYPYGRDKELLTMQMERLLSIFHCSWPDVYAVKGKLDEIRKKVHQIDQMTWESGTVTGFENHIFQVSCSDMQGNPDRFSAEVDQFLEMVSARSPGREKIRLGFIGVPSVYSDLYSFIESHEARIVFNEVQRQFSMPHCGQGEDLVSQYVRYTYPYDIFGRIADIREQAAVRHLDGLIHYTQSFCSHRLEDLVIRKAISLPILTLEGDNPGRLDARTQIRLESFLQLLKEKKELI